MGVPRSPHAGDCFARDDLLTSAAMKTLLSASLLALVAATPAAARQLTIQDVTKLSRIGAPTMSGDGR